MNRNDAKEFRRNEDVKRAFAHLLKTYFKLLRAHNVTLIKARLRTFRRKIP